MWTALGEEVTEAFASVGSSGWYVLGPEVEKFENDLKHWFNAENAVGCANGLDAINIAFRVLKANVGDSFLTTPLSAFATTLAGIKLGLKPIFCDVDQFGNIDLGMADELLSRSDIKFFVPVHLYGVPLDLHKLSEIKKNRNVFIIEDCAQAIGATYDNSYVGSVGHLSATSFYPTKNLGAMGDGGALLTNSSEYAALARCLRDYGQSEKYVHSHIGENSRLDEVHAGLLRRVFLPRLGAWTERRKQIAKFYQSQIKNDSIQIVFPKPKAESVFHLFPIFVKERPHFMNYLKKNDVASGIHYPGLIPDQPVMKNIEFEVVGSLNNARKIVSQEVSLPIHPWLTDAEVEKVIVVCNAWRPS
jgi:dTDP-3-amino-3,4,6-trideoxy-alpha-D-glucose transaminase